MEVTQSQVFPHPRQEVWDKLMDFGVLGRTLPGIEKLEPIDAESCRLSVKVLVPSITGNYDGTVRVVEKQPIDSLRLRGEAKGRLGWVKGDALFELADAAGQTQVSSVMNIQTGGVLSGVGQRFMQAIAKSMIRDFFSAFGAELERAEPPAAAYPG
jgi:carbon monoxide dehydrogenase subunit G